MTTAEKLFLGVMIGLITLLIVQTHWHVHEIGCKVGVTEQCSRLY